MHLPDKFLTGLVSLLLGSALIACLHAASVSAASELASTASTATASSSADPFKAKPRSMSLVAEFAALEKRAAAGDASAARKLSADIRRCEHIHVFRELQTKWERQYAPGGAFAGKSHDVMPAGYLLEKDAIMRDEQGLCAGFSHEQNDGRAYQVMLQAADMGDQDSAECYVATRYPFIPGKYPATDREPYKENARRLLDEAIRHGQWGVVRAVADGMTATWIDYYPLSASLRGDPVVAYRLQKLLRLGAGEGTAEARFLDANLERGGKILAPAQLAKADAWAKTMFERYYATSGPSTPFTTACDHRSITYTFN